MKKIIKALKNQKEYLESLVSTREDYVLENHAALGYEHVEEHTAKTFKILEEIHILDGVINNLIELNKNTQL